MRELLGFIFFLIWLWLFPMEGALLSESGIKNGLTYFLIPHSLTLLSFLWLNTDIVNRLTIYCIIFTSLATILFPYFISYYHINLFLIGLSSAFFVLRAVSVLKNLKNPPLFSALGFAIASILLFLIGKIDFVNLKIKFLIIGLLPLFSLFLRELKTGEEKDGEINVTYAPFIYFFYLVGGIMYGFIMPSYQKYCFLQGLELFYYVFACFLGYLLMKIERIFALLGGIIFGMLAFSFNKIEEALFYNLSMFFIHAAFGIVEIFIVSFVLTQRSTRKAISVLFSSMCLGIISGNFISLYLSNYASMINSVGNISLIISAGLILFFERKSKDKEEKQTNIEETPYKSEEELPNSHFSKALKKRLSPKEYIALEHILNGKTYKEVAEIMDISESTVKTYMKRIFDKEGVNGKKELIEKIGAKFNENRK